MTSQLMSLTPLVRISTTSNLLNLKWISSNPLGTDASKRSPRALETPNENKKRAINSASLQATNGHSFQDLQPVASLSKKYFLQNAVITFRTLSQDQIDTVHFCSTYLSKEDSLGPESLDIEEHKPFSSTKEDPALNAPT